MIDLDRIVDALGTSGVAPALRQGPAAGAHRGAAAGLLPPGGLDAVAAVAWRAYDDTRRRQREAERRGRATLDLRPADIGYRRWRSVSERDFTDVVAGRGAGARLLVRAMIGAALADGHVDRRERARIFAEVERMDLTPEERASLTHALLRPWTLEQVATLAGDPQTATQVYAASLLAVNRTSPAAREYLERLARVLDLPPALVGALHDEVEVEQAVVAA